MGSYSFYQEPLRSDELYHHGIKGMHWGVRRFQNENGSLTGAGKKRYLTAVGAVKKVAGAAQNSIDKTKTPMQRQQKDRLKMSTTDQARTPQQRQQTENAKKLLSGGLKEKWDNASPKTKKALKAGSALVAAGLAAYGAHKYSQYKDDMLEAKSKLELNILNKSADDASRHTRWLTGGGKIKLSPGAEEHAWNQFYTEAVKAHTPSNKKEYRQAVKKFLPEARSERKSAAIRSKIAKKKIKEEAINARKRAQREYLTKNLPKHVANVDSAYKRGTRKMR